MAGFRVEGGVWGLFGSGLKVSRFVFLVQEGGRCSALWVP